MKQAKPSKAPKEEPTQAVTPVTDPMMMAMTELLSGVLAFHKAPEVSKDEDLRLYWDVRLVRGKEEPWAHISGTATLPGATTLPMLPASLQDEIEKKIINPLVAQAQLYVQERQDADLVEDINIADDTRANTYALDHNVMVAEQAAAEASEP